MKKLLNELRLGCEKIHACAKNCILYTKEYVNVSVCPLCKESMWKDSKVGNDEERKKKPS